VIVADLAGGTRRLEGRLPIAVLWPGHRSRTGLPPGAWRSTKIASGSIRRAAPPSLPGIFAIGDIASYPGKLKLILSGFAEAALAAHAIHPLVHPGEALHFEYSTMKGVPGAKA